MGQIKILELREKAKAVLGQRFSLKDFHAVVLENGGVPVTPRVDGWIAATLKPTGQNAIAAPDPDGGTPGPWSRSRLLVTERSGPPQRGPGRVER